MGSEQRSTWETPNCGFFWQKKKKLWGGEITGLKERDSQATPGLLLQFLKAHSWAQSQFSLITSGQEECSEGPTEVCRKHKTGPGCERGKTQRPQELGVRKPKMKFNSTKWRGIRRGENFWEYITLRIYNTENSCCGLAAAAKDRGERFRVINPSQEMWHGHEKAKKPRKQQVIPSEMSYIGAGEISPELLNFSSRKRFWRADKGRRSCLVRGN